MKAITIYQPYASLIAEGHKIYEPRAFYTKYRGPIAIHSARVIDPDVFKFMLCPISTVLELERCGVNAYNVDNLSRSTIIAMAELVDIWEVEKSTIGGEIVLRKLKNTDNLHHCQYRPTATTITLDRKEAALGDWHKGTYAWEFRNVKALELPIPAKGSPRLWDWDPETESKEDEDNV